MLRGLGIPYSIYPMAAVLTTDIGTPIITRSHILQMWLRILPHLEINTLTAKEDYGISRGRAMVRPNG